MRRPIFVAVLSTLLMVACSEQPTEGNPPDRTPSPSADIGVGACQATPTIGQILTQVNQLLPNSPIRLTVIALLNSLPSRFQDRLKIVIRNQIYTIQDLVLKTFYAGKLTGGTSTGTFDKVLDLIRSLYCYVGLTPPAFPSTTTGSDIVVGVVFPNSPKTTISTPSHHGAVTIPAGAAPAPTTIVIRILPDSPGPLLTSLNQYPLFYEFSGTTATGPVVFNQFVTAGVCLKNPIPVSDANLRLAHNVGPNFGDVEILPRPTTVPGVSCANLPVAFRTTQDNPMFATGPGRWGAVSRALEPLAQALLPEPLHATSVALATTAVGGTTKKFSPFGVVDITSNPGEILFNPNEEAFSGLSAAPGQPVSPAPSVQVTSKNGTAVVNVPVLFAVTGGGGTINDGQTSVTVTTDANGVATLADWTLGSEPGTNTLRATPPSGPQVGSAPLAYKPAVAFTAGEGTYLTFSAEATGNELVFGNDPGDLTFYEGEGSTALRWCFSCEPTSRVPSVILRDGEGTPIGGVEVTVTLIPTGANTNGNFTSGSTNPVVTNSDESNPYAIVGEARFDDLYIENVFNEGLDECQGTYKLRFTAEGAAPLESGEFTVSECGG